MVHGHEYVDFKSLCENPARKHLFAGHGIVKSEIVDIFISLEILYLYIVNLPFLYSVATVTAKECVLISLSGLLMPIYRYGLSSADRT